jgi:hypothetical protein
VLNLIMEPFAEGDDPPDAHCPTIAVDQPIGTEDDLGQLAKPDPGDVAVRINEGHACGFYCGSNRLEVGGKPGRAPDSKPERIERST